ncbi:unnamed protein product, partial [Porites lobata]
NNCLSLLHLNIRSLHRNLDSLTTLLKNLELRFSFIGITETWLRDSSHHTDISGYNFVHTPRKDRTDGGVQVSVMFCTTELFLLMTIFILNEHSLIFLQVTLQEIKNIIVGVVYRPPNQNCEIL